MPSDDLRGILPAAASPQERALDAAAAARFAALPPSVIGAAWNADDIAEEFLAPLAWAMSLDTWNPAWTVAEKRAAIKQSAALHRKKGTDAGVIGALADLGLDASIDHWHSAQAANWWKNSGAHPAPYTMRVNYSGAHNQNPAAAQINHAINANKRASVWHQLNHQEDSDIALRVIAAAHAELAATSQQGHAAPLEFANIFSSDVFAAFGYPFQSALPAGLTNVDNVARLADGAYQWPAPIASDTPPPAYPPPPPPSPLAKQSSSTCKRAAAQTRGILASCRSARQTTFWAFTCAPTRRKA